MRVKYLRVSTINQTGNRFEADTEKYDLVLFEKVSGKIPFRERSQAKKIIELIEKGINITLIIDELSRIGRTTSDTINMMEYFESKEINVVVKNLGIESRPNGKKNPIWNLITTVISSLNAMELESIKERTMAGRQVYVANGGILGRRIGSTLSDRDFIEKPKSKKILEYLDKGWTIREIAKQVDASTKTVMKVKSTATKLQMI